MIRQVPPMDPDAPAIVLDIGNSTIGIGTWCRRELKAPLSVPTTDGPGLEKAFRAHLESIPDGRLGAVIVASVVPAALKRVRDYVETKVDQTVLVIGENLPLPLDLDVRDGRAVGVDRVCAAAAAFDRLQRACVVVGFGTAVTVDLVSEEGTFQGGAILPGVRVQLQSLHEHTAQLPEVSAAVPELPYGKSTSEAIQTGVCRGIAGAVRGIVEGYATSLNFWPQVVATGGDLALLGPLCDCLDTQVSDLVLCGVGVAYDKHLRERGAR